MSLLLALNPFAIYSCSFYSESVFFLTQSSLLWLIQRSVAVHSRLTFPSLALSMLPLLLGCFVRSNGFLSVGFPVYYLLMLQPSKNASKIKHICKCFVPIVVMVILSFLPFFVYNFWGFYSICSHSVASDRVSELCSSHPLGPLFICFWPAFI